VKVVGLGSLYEPLPFLEDRIRTLNDSVLRDVLIYWVDCSPPAVFEEVRRIVEDKCRFGYRLEHLPERTTLYWTWNHIIEKTRECTEFFTPINVDDLQDPLYFQKMTSFLDEHPEFLIATCPWLLTDAKGQDWPPTATGTHLVVDTRASLGHFPMWRSAAHDAVGLFDPAMVASGDWDFWDRIRERFGRGKFGVHPEPLGCHLLHENNLRRTGTGPSGECGQAWDRRVIARRGRASPVPGARVRAEGPFVPGRHKA
jgi:hypothetical protein